MKKSPLNRGTSQLKRTPLARGTKKLSDRAKKHTQPWYRKECVKVAKLIAKHRDEYTCVNPGCGRNSADGYQMHGSHILPESKFHRMSCVPDNIMTQCARCHMNWHEHPLGQEWFDETFTGLKEKLDFKAKLIFKKPFYMTEAADGPYCPKCWDDEKKGIRLEGPKSEYLSWDCPKCKNRFMENPNFQPPPIRFQR